MRAINNGAQTRLTELQTLSLVEGSNPPQYTVTVQSEVYSLGDWCRNATGNGKGAHKAGALVTLSSYVTSLSDMFSALDTDNSALELWIEIAQAAQKCPSSSTFSKYSNKTVYELVAILMNELYTMLGIIYYVHDASLSLLQQSEPEPKPGEPTYVSISGQIQASFGSTSDTSSTVWHKFAKELEALATGPQTYTGSGINPIDPQAQISNASRTCDQYPGDDSSMNADSYSAVQYETSVSNSFFTALQMQPVSKGSREVCLQGMLVTIGPNLQLTANKTAPTAINPGVPPIQQASNNINVLYPVPPTPTSNNVISVVTGFAFCEVGSGNNKGMGIALQFGELDITDLNKPVVRINDHTFVQPGIPDNPTHVGMPFTADLRPAGAFEAQIDSKDPVNRLGIMTNASLLITHDVEGGRVGLNVQMAAPIYKADFFQPGNLPKWVKTDTSSNPNPN